MNDSLAPAVSAPAATSQGSIPPREHRVHLAVNPYHADLRHHLPDPEARRYKWRILLGDATAARSVKDGNSATFVVMSVVLAMARTLQLCEETKRFLVRFGEPRKKRRTTMDDYRRVTPFVEFTSGDAAKVHEAIRSSWRENGGPMLPDLDVFMHLKKAGVSVPLIPYLEALQKTLNE